MRCIFLLLSGASSHGNICGAFSSVSSKKSARCLPEALGADTARWRVGLSHGNYVRVVHCHSLITLLKCSDRRSSSVGETDLLKRVPRITPTYWDRESPSSILCGRHSEEQIRSQQSTMEGILSIWLPLNLNKKFFSETLRWHCQPIRLCVRILTLFYENLSKVTGLFFLPPRKNSLAHKTT